MYNSKISFNYFNDEGISITVALDGDSPLPEVFEQLKGFLLAIGYSVKGDIIVVCEEND